MDCAHFTANRCRSCSQLPAPYPEQLAAKLAHAQTLLSAHSQLRWLPTLSGAEAGFRNKAKMVVSGSVDAPVLGIVDAHGQGVDLRDCALYPPSLQAAFVPLPGFIRAARLVPYDVSARRGELKYLLLTESPAGELMLRLVLRSRESLPRIGKRLDALRAALPRLRVISVNLQPDHKAVLEGETEILLSGESALRMNVDALGLDLYLQPQGFFQTRSDLAGALYAQARAWCRQVQPQSVWDLYCGVGGFALACAGEGRQVTGVELSRAAIEAACRARDTQGMSGVEFIATDATRWALDQPASPELVVVNPPRRGIGAELCGWLQQSKVQTLIYSSCNADSLARDLAAMPAFVAREARLLDMFPHTLHYETILLLQRNAG